LSLGHIVLLLMVAIAGGFAGLIIVFLIAKYFF
jgi:hypothetical protein